LEREGLIAEQLGQPTARWVYAYHAAAFELLRGNLAAAERLAARAFEIGQEAEQAQAVLIYGDQLNHVLIYEGRGEEVIAGLDAAMRALPAIVALRAQHAMTLCWVGRSDEAATIIERAAHDRFAHVIPGVTKLITLAQYADCAAQTRSSDEAAILYELLEPS